MVISDVVMPRMRGIEMAARLRKTHPHLPILFVTGYVEQSEALHESAGGAPVLLKPFSPEALLRAVSSTLQAARKEPRLMT
jgi:two-component system cell cycle sensor histidine kinase/response regulator CckA